ncbi:MAG TPA: hypothetical protein VFP06_20985 [Acidimicrobiales bacterium]|nr:hypothetical protein [Acidimicrobiales bacterium]
MLGVDDLVLISVDDHLIEPPDLFVDHLDARYLDRAPKLVRNDEDVSVMSRSTRVRTADEKLEGYRSRARRAVAAGAAR